MQSRVNDPLTALRFESCSSITYFTNIRAKLRAMKLGRLVCLLLFSLTAFAQQPRTYVLKAARLFDKANSPPWRRSGVFATKPHGKCPSRAKARDYARR
ncbi:MAG: hypothetical protein DMG14_34215 [Acidobacteria bacterium]|nr:MAG: hypothetical protein DMG14_34215 [Acidobacteriota bacterium]